ncbi:unnamed protein product [Oikopleura dioica]|uniref:Uncharacterized protein n=1 Tax=Oikopleura dioica TaxID=34765 RepID=E4XNC1_OIKDI|nr:unnamed protein product [Oikopleura dioica]
MKTKLLHRRRSRFLSDLFLFLRRKINNPIIRLQKMKALSWKILSRVKQMIKCKRKQSKQMNGNQKTTKKVKRKTSLKKAR